MGAVAWLMRRQGFHALVYMDDFVGCEASLTRARQAFDYLRAICGCLGHRPTSAWPPSPALYGSGLRSARSE